MRGSDMVAGRYRLEHRIAAGGMGEVWRGFDTRLDRPVAVKLLHSGMSGNDRFRARFQAEAKSVAALQAPGVVAMYDYGEEETPDGLESYLVMELVEGNSMADILRDHGRLTARDAMRIIAEAAEGLHAAHQIGIVHRDVKPGNILLDKEQRVKIVDFGIARARGEAGLTETGMVMGTVAYTSPEQLCDHDLIASSDVYSLAIVAYECLTGRTPFASENPGAVINGHMNQPPPPMPQDVPAPVAQVIEKALAKSPRDRWESAAQFAQACREAAGGGGTTAVLASQPSNPTRMMPRDQATQRMDPAPAPPPPPPARPREPVPASNYEEPEKRSAVLPVLATLAIVAVIGALIVLWRPWDRGDAAADEESKSNSQSENTPSEDDGDEDDSSPESDPPSEDSNDPTSPSNEPTSPEEPATVPMPDLAGTDHIAASQQLKESGFEDVRVTPDEQDGGDCTVTEQDPPAQEEVTPKETPVELTISGTTEDCPTEGEEP